MWKKWAKAAGIRAIRTVAQGAIGAIGSSLVFSDVDWKVVAGTAVLAGILSLLTSLAGLPEVEEEEKELIDYENVEIDFDKADKGLNADGKTNKK